jgi:uncharacterized protein
MLIDHTETRQELEGRGLATRLVKKSVEFARETEYESRPVYVPLLKCSLTRIRTMQDVRVD